MLPQLIMEYHISKKVSLNFEEAISCITEELRKEGFGIIDTIDVKRIFREKLNVHFRNYIILGACNPRFAYEALLAEDKIGVFLPCNVIVQQHENEEVEISVINPEELMKSSVDFNLKRLQRMFEDRWRTPYAMCRLTDWITAICYFSHRLK